MTNSTVSWAPGESRATQQAFSTYDCKIMFPVDLIGLDAFDVIGAICEERGWVLRGVMADHHGSREEYARYEGQTLDVAPFVGFVPED